MISTDSSTDQSFVIRSFGPSSSSAPEQPSELGVEPQGPEPKALKKPILAVSASLAALGLLALLASTGFATEVDPVIEQAQHTAIELNIQTELAGKQAAGLPEASKAMASITSAKAAATSVARWQNEYSVAVPRMVADKGVLSDELAESSRRGLTSLFSLNVDDTALEPWYLLASDASVPSGSLVPTLFSSGVSWEANEVTQVNIDGSVPVTWVAYDRPDHQKMLAWAHGDFDTRQQVFTNLTIGTTSSGASLELEWSLPNE